MSEPQGLVGFGTVIVPMVGMIDGDSRDGIDDGEADTQKADVAVKGKQQGTPAHGDGGSEEFSARGS